MLVLIAILLSPPMLALRIGSQHRAENSGNPVWSQRLNICDFAKNGRRIISDGIAVISPNEVTAYCVMKAPHPHPRLNSRNGKPSSYPYQMLAMFLDPTDGYVLQKASWPTLVNTQADILPVGDKRFLLVAGDAIQLVNQGTLSTLDRLQLPFPGRGCEPWRVKASLDGSSFGVSQICDAGPNYKSEISIYRTADFAEIGSWKDEGRNFYDVYDGEISRWSTDPELDHDIFFRGSDGVETDLRAVGFTVERNLFVNRNELLCCRNETQLRIIADDGHVVASYDVDPKHSPDNPKVMADQIFVSRTGHRVASLIFHVPWAGPVHWECDVFDQRLNRLLRFKIPAYHHDLTVALSPDDKYVFVLRDDQIDAYRVPES